jgi:serine O-acetyltransferase
MNAIVLHRLGHALHRRRLIRLAKIVESVIFLLFNSYIPSSAQIGSGSRFAYGGIGVVIHAASVIGAKCVLGQGITIGARQGYASAEVNAAPKIGDHVYLAAGCRIIGAITIGDRCIVGAGAVVTRSFPSHSIIAGVPAVVIGSTESDYRAFQ